LEQTKTNGEKTKSRKPTSLHLTCIIVGSGEMRGDGVLDYSSFAVSLFPYFSRVYLSCIVPQYGRLAAISILLAFNHSACLRNARRISYQEQVCGIFTSAEQTTFNFSKTLQYLSFFPSFLPYLHRQKCV
jgi:hypothetical protein